MTSAAVDRIDRQGLLLREEMVDQSVWTEVSAPVNRTQKQSPGDQLQNDQVPPQQQEQQLQEDQSSQDVAKSADRPSSKPLLREKVGSLGRQLKQRLLRHQPWGKKNYDQLS